MNDTMNRLRAWMQMYDDQGMGADPNAYGLNMHPASRGALRDEWARQMMDREDRAPAPAGDYFNFGEEHQQMPQQQAVAPIRDVEGLRAQLGASMGRPPVRNQLLSYFGRK